MNLTQEKRAVREINKSLLREERKNIYIACEDMDFVWSEGEVLQFDFLWNKGKSLIEIAEFFDRSVNEVGLLLLDRASKGEVKPREKGIF